MGRKALGKGLEALIPTEEGTSKIPLKDIKPGTLQPRKKIDKKQLEELASSIKEKGVLQPVLVRKKGKYYELVYGHRRYQAAKMAGLKEIPAVVKDLTDREVLEISIIENVQREDLNPVEEAEAYRTLMIEFGLTQEQVAERVGKDRSTIANKLRLLNLPEEIRNALSEGLITEGHARPLLSLKTREEMLRAFHEILKTRESVRKTEKRVKRIKEKDTEILHIEQELIGALGTKVVIQRGRNKGKIEIYFYSDEELVRLIRLLKGEKE